MTPTTRRYCKVKICDSDNLYRFVLKSFPSDGGLGSRELPVYSHYLHNPTIRGIVDAHRGICPSLLSTSNAEPESFT